MNTSADGQTVDETTGRTGRSREGTKLLRLFAALVVVNGLFLGPDWVQLGGVGPGWIAPEACLLVAIFALLPRARATRIAAWVAGVFVASVFVLELGDTTLQLSLSRPLNLYVDVWLVDSGSYANQLLLESAHYKACGLDDVAGPMGPREDCP